MKHKCPTCKKIINPPASDHEASKYLPFCSERCKLIDLGAWLDGQYRVISNPPIHKEDEPNEEP